MMLFGLLIPVLLVAALAYALGWRPGQNASFDSFGKRQSPLDVLKERYARGEISRDVYDQMRRDLE